MTYWGFTKVGALLRTDFDLSSNYIFYYYQLRHAVCAQFGSLDSPIQVPHLEKMLRWPDPTKLISIYYSSLAAQIKLASLNIPLVDANWTESSDTYKNSVISPKDRKFLAV